MPSYTILQLKEKLQAQTLPRTYDLLSAIIESKHLMEILSLCKNVYQMRDLVDVLKRNSKIWITELTEKTQLGTNRQFLLAFAKGRFYHSLLPKEKQAAILTHFKSHLSKADILFFITALNNDELPTVMGSFPLQTLKEIVNDGKNLRTIPEVKIGLLYHYLNPTRCWKTSMTPLLDMYYFSKRCGHILGISTSISTKTNEYHFNYSTQFEFSEVFFNILTKYLDSYRHRYPCAVWDEIYYGYQRTNRLMQKFSNLYHKGAHLELWEQYQQDKLVILTFSSNRHASGIALRGKYIVYSNRGPGGDPRAGCKIFEITNSSLLYNFIKSITTNEFNSYNQFHSELAKLIVFKNPVARFRSKSQKYSNCTLANLKSLLEPLMVLVQSNPQATPLEIKKIAYRESKRGKYKHFTKTIRDGEIDELIKNMFYATNEPLIHFFANLTKMIIREHHGKETEKNTLKNKQEIIRAVTLFERLPETVLKIVKQDTKFMDLINKVQNENQPIVEQAKPLAITWQRDRLYQRNNITVDNGYIIAVNEIDTPKMPYTNRNVRKLLSVAKL